MGWARFTASDSKKRTGASGREDFLLSTVGVRGWLFKLLYYNDERIVLRERNR